MPEMTAWPSLGPMGQAAPPQFEPYPERSVENLSPMDRRVLGVVAPLAKRVSLPGPGSFRRRVSVCNREGARVASLSDEALDAEILRARAGLRRVRRQKRLTDLALALVRETCKRVLGMRPYDVQVLAALALLDGRLAEMETGEGKSLSAAIAAAVAGLSGTPTHVVTVNDYLAARDAEAFRPLFERLCLSVGVIVHENSAPERRLLYGDDILYISNKELAFDYLRDRVRMGGAPASLPVKLEKFRASTDEEDRLPVLRGLHFAIVDEADSVLIDEARTPLILSRETDSADEARWAEEAFRLLDLLVEDEDFRVDRRERRIVLTDPGKARLDRLTAASGSGWRNRVRREETLRQAIQARYLLERGDQYVVRDGTVVIVDEYTGRLMPERSWSDGLHQLVELKEGVEVTSQKLTLARMTYQRFFARYVRLSGMTGTAREVSGELSRVYRLDYLAVPPRRRSQMQVNPTRIVQDQAAKMSLLVDRVSAMRKAGRPVLVGTRSVAASQAVSAALKAAVLPHSVLNALEDEQEASVIAAAGQAGAVTVATNMAGRGVHIDIGETVERAGGLHVILTERHDSARIDRQLKGRTARQGQRGSFEAILARDDSILDGHTAPLAGALGKLGGRVRQATDRYRFGKAQAAATRLNARARKALLDYDRHLDQFLSFSGAPE